MFGPAFNCREVHASSIVRKVQPMSIANTKGLCESCLHERTIVSDKGSRFVMCERWREKDSVFPKYPRLPVLVCGGYEARTDDPIDEKIAVDQNK
jgi:hypothetical protein